MIKIVVIGWLLFVIRNTYTLYCNHKTIDLVSKYTMYLIEKGQYTDKINYQEEMQMNYFKHMFSIWLWGKYSIVKPEYQKLLNSFMKIDEQKIIDVIYDDISKTV